MYLVSGSVSITRKDGYTSSRQIPTFLLDPQIQGIVSTAHAEDIARHMLGDLLAAAGAQAELHLCVMPGW